MYSIYGPELKLAMLKFLYSYSSLEWTMIPATMVKQVVTQTACHSVFQCFNRFEPHSYHMREPNFCLQMQWYRPFTI